jgi:hypothetical protein
MLFESRNLSKICIGSIFVSQLQFARFLFNPKPVAVSALHIQEESNNSNSNMT